MVEKESFLKRIALIVLKAVMIFGISYFILTEYVFYWYLKDHHKTTIGTVVGIENFENGGYVYRYEYLIDGIRYTNTSLPDDYRNPPEIGKSYVVKYLEFMPSISGCEF